MPADELDIRHGGAVAVDTETLRRAATGWTRIARDAWAAADELRRACALASGVGAGGTLWATLGDVEAAAAAAERTASRLTRVADTYELIELQGALQFARGTGDTAAAEQLGQRQRELAGDTATMAAATGGVLRHVLGEKLGFAVQAGIQTPDRQLLWAMLLGTVGLLGAGRIDAGDRLEGVRSAVEVTALRRSAHTGADVDAPRGVADLVGRIPSDGDARVRVETYTLPDGGRTHAVYVTGTRPEGVGDAWNMHSNVELYAGRPSTSYDAVLAALADVGVAPDEPLHLIGHSQGVLVTSRLVSEGAYTVASHVSVGGPVEVAAGPRTLQVTLRHRDDPIVQLADTGLPHPTGAPGSLVASRTVHPAAGLQDGLFGAHHLDTYVDTARMLDASTDPRVDALETVFAGLGAATAVSTVVYGATRVPEPARPRRGVSASAAGAAAPRTAS